MTEFPDRPELYLVEPSWYELREDYAYQWRHEGIQYHLEVKAGFCTDLASTPRALWWLISPQDVGLGPPLVHDMIYACRGDVAGYGWGESQVRRGGEWRDTDRWSRYNADRLFGRHMREAGVGRIRRRLAYLGVRAGGCWAWIGTRPGDDQY